MRTSLICRVLANEYTPILIVHHASKDFGVNRRYRKALQLDGFVIKVYNDGMTQLDMLFVCTICVGVNIYSVRFINILAKAEKIADRSCKEHPMRLSRDDILLSSLLTDCDIAIRKPPNPESMIVGHSNGGKGLFKRTLSNKAMIIGVKLAISAKKKLETVLSIDIHQEDASGV